MLVNTKRGGSSASTSFGVNLQLVIDKIALNDSGNEPL